MARQFSQSPTAAAGGDLGWVYQGQLPAELDAELQKMEIGQVSEPIRSAGGYYIMGLRDKALGANVVLPDPATLKPVGPLTVARVLLPLPPNTPKAFQENAMKLAVQIHDHVSGCDGLPKVAEQVRGLVYQDLQKMGLKITDLSPDIQAAIAQGRSRRSDAAFQLAGRHRDDGPLRQARARTAQVQPALPAAGRGKPVRRPDHDAVAALYPRSASQRQCRDQVTPRRS